jgi:hypothetical protein
MVVSTSVTWTDEPNILRHQAGNRQPACMCWPWYIRLASNNCCKSFHATCSQASQRSVHQLDYRCLEPTNRKPSLLSPVHQELGAPPSLRAPVGLAPLTQITTTMLPKPARCTQRRCTCVAVAWRPSTLRPGNTQEKVLLINHTSLHQQAPVSHRIQRGTWGPPYWNIYRVTALYTCADIMHAQTT